MDEITNAASSTPRRVLVVEDDEGLRTLIVKSLNKAGFDAQGAANGAAAVQRAAAEPCLVLLLDQKLPDMTGRDIVQALSQRGIPAHFIVMTGQGDERLAVEMMKLGAADYLVKDLELNDRLPSVLERVFHTLETERKLLASQEALRESEEKHRILLDESSDPIFAFNPDGQYRYVNKAFALGVGRKQEEIIGKKIWDVFAKDEADKRYAAVKWVFENKVAKIIEVRVPRPEGDQYYITTVKPILNAQGEVTVAICVSKNITERKMAEEALRVSEARFKAQYQGSPIPTFTWQKCDDDFVLKDCNEAARIATGGRTSQLIGKAARQMYRDSPGILENMQRCYGEHGVIRNEWISEHFMPGRLVLTTYAFVPPDFVLVHVDDITDRKRAEEEREKLQAQLNQAQKMESVGRLAGGVAHDFNNMLGVILGYTELTLAKLPPSDPLRDNLKEIFKAANRSAEVTRQLLAFARKQTIAPQALDLNETVEGMLKMLRRLIGEDIDLAWLPGTGLWPIKMDPSQIDQILANLCVNARDAIADFGKITIETSKVTIDDAYCATHPDAVPGNFVLLAVSDDGCGMSPEILANLFEPFFTTKDVDKGTGLGLATVYGIVKQNNGFINVYSEPGKGTTFEIYLPRLETLADRSRKKDPEALDAQGSETILLVEDEPAILKMTKIILERQGYTVLPANGPGQALGLAREHAGQIHLLMTDVIMPEMNGSELAQHLLSIYPNLKRLFMSGYTADVIAHHGVLAPGVHYIQKPFSMGALAAKLREVLD